MRFLCLHGKGTNSQVLEGQLSAVRYQLGGEHDYDFVEGTIKENVAPEMGALFSSSAEFFGYFDEKCPRSCLAAVDLLERYIDVQGPFDGIIAFSQGCALAATMLARQARRSPDAVKVKMAIFFSGGVPADSGLLERGVIAPLDSVDVGEVIQIPTAHIWGVEEQGELQWPPRLLQLCKAETREQFQHRGGHEIPGSKERLAVTKVVQAIRRTMWRVVSDASEKRGGGQKA